MIGDGAAEELDDELGGGGGVGSFGGGVGSLGGGGVGVRGFGGGGVGVRITSTEVSELDVDELDELGTGGGVGVGVGTGVGVFGFAT